jgi:alpha-L-rhamnosidase
MAIALGCGGEPSRQFVITADNEAKVWIEEVLRGEIQDWQRPLTIELSPEQKDAVIAVEAHNRGGVAGLVAGVTYRDAEGQPVEQLVDWVCSSQPQDDWQRGDFDDSGWQSPKVMATYGANPWGNAAALELKQASWVWPTDPAGADDTVYCRARLADPAG